MPRSCTLHLQPSEAWRLACMQGSWSHFSKVSYVACSHETNWQDSREIWIKFVTGILGQNAPWTTWPECSDFIIMCQSWSWCKMNNFYRFVCLFVFWLYFEWRQLIVRNIMRYVHWRLHIDKCKLHTRIPRSWHEFPFGWPRFLHRRDNQLNILSNVNQLHTKRDSNSRSDLETCIQCANNADVFMVFLWKHWPMRSSKSDSTMYGFSTVPKGPIGCSSKIFLPSKFANISARSNPVA